MLGDLPFGDIRYSFLASSNDVELLLALLVLRGGAQVLERSCLCLSFRSEDGKGDIGWEVLISWREDRGCSGEVRGIEFLTETLAYDSLL